MAHAMNGAERSIRSPRPRSALRELLRGESAAGLILIGAATAALLVANSPLSKAYFDLLHSYAGALSILHWINDGLMALFFLLVGLEIKREFVDGQLSTWPRRTLPAIAAVGGMVVPGLIFLFVNRDAPENVHGWAVPTATDIAFALGVLALLGKRVPVSLKVFLTALAIIDDLGAVLIIALLYTVGLSLPWLAAAAAALALLVAMNRMKVERLSPYLVVGVLLWFFVLKSGVHATLAGVALAMAVPLRRSPGRPDASDSPLHRLEHQLHPLVAYAVLPLFGFANAGVALGGLNLASLLAPLPLGIAAGLFVGKQLGVFGFTWAAIGLDWADCPRDASMAQVYGVSLLCGIGFTMSLFIGLLAFPEAPEIQDGVKLGVLLGSLCSAFAGVAVLAFARREAAPVRRASSASANAIC